MNSAKLFFCIIVFGIASVSATTAKKLGIIYPPSEFATLSDNPNKNYNSTNYSGIITASQISPKAPLGASKLFIDVNGSQRTYYLFSTSNLNKKNVPLLLMLHGGGGSAESSIKFTKLGSLGPLSGIDVIFPEGSNLGHPYRWNTGLPTGTDIDKVKDIEFIDKLVKKYASEKRPIFLAGLSNGGMMVLNQLCNGTTRFDGAFVVAGGTSQQILDQCHANVRMPILLVHGLQDSVVPYGGGLVVRGSREKSTTLSETPLVSHTKLVDFWRRRNICRDTYKSSIPILSLQSNQEINIKDYVTKHFDCKQTLSIVLNEGDHGWPTDPDKLTFREKMALHLRQRIAGALIGKISVDPGDLDTTGIILKLIDHWSSQAKGS